MEVSAEFRERQVELERLVERNWDLGSKVAADLDRALLTLSSGGLVFSMTFVTTLAPRMLWLPLLISSWFFFAVTLGAVILATVASQAALGTEYRLIQRSRAQMMPNFFIPPSPPLDAVGENKKTDRRIRWVTCFNVIALFSFFIALILLAIFVAHNVRDRSQEHDDIVGVYLLGTSIC